MKKLTFVLTILMSLSSLSADYKCGEFYYIQNENSKYDVLQVLNNTMTKTTTITKIASNIELKPLPENRDGVYFEYSHSTAWGLGTFGRDYSVGLQIDNNSLMGMFIVYVYVRPLSNGRSGQATLKIQCEKNKYSLQDLSKPLE
jgi:hypothetical protein